MQSKFTKSVAIKLVYLQLPVDIIVFEFYILEMIFIGLELIHLLSLNSELETKFQMERVLTEFLIIINKIEIIIPNF